MLVGSNPFDVFLNLRLVIHIAEARNRNIFPGKNISALLPKPVRRRAGTLCASIEHSFLGEPTMPVPAHDGAVFGEKPQVESAASRMGAIAQDSRFSGGCPPM